MSLEFSAGNIGKVAAWGLPLVFVAGGLYITIQSLGQDVDEISTRQDTHEDLEAHPVSHVRIEDLSTQQTNLMVEQRAMRGDLAEQAVNIAAICQATGATCR